MDTDRLNRWLTLAANIGVIIGLVLLVAEIRQTNAIAKAEAINALTQNVYTLLELHRDPRHIDALDRVNEVGWEDLTKEEEILLSTVEAMAMRHFENAYYQHKLGVYDDGQLEAVLWNLDRSLDVPWRLEHWEDTKASHTREFRAFVENRLRDAADEMSK